MDFTVYLARPDGYAHSAAFLELAELIGHGLSDLGHGAQLTVNSVIPGTRPILIGVHLMDPALIRDMPADTIVLNTEQINARTGTWNARVLEWASHFETWDYSNRNIEELSRQSRMPIRHLRIGYHPALERIRSAPNQDIDVLFYGSSSERRVRLIDQLKATGMNVKAMFGVYGPERDALIARSRIVLNMHNFATQIFEIVRVFYLLINRKAVVSEVGPDTAIDPEYRSGIAGVPYDEIPNACLRLLENDADRRELEARGFATISSLPQASLLAPLLI